MGARTEKEPLSQNLLGQIPHSLQSPEPRLQSKKYFKKFQAETFNNFTLYIFHCTSKNVPMDI